MDQLPLRILILAGGIGSRMRPLTTETPKPLLPLGGSSILERLLSQTTNAFGKSDVYINFSYRPEQITAFVAKQPIIDRPFLIWEAEPQGTAVTVLDLFEFNPSQRTLVLHGDLVLSNEGIVRIAKMILDGGTSFMVVHKRKRSLARSIVLTRGSKIVKITESEKLDSQSFDMESEVLVNSGIFYFEANALQDISAPPKGTEISPYLINELANLGSLEFRLWKGERISVDSISSYESAKQLAANDPQL